MTDTTREENPPRRDPTDAVAAKEAASSPPLKGSALDYLCKLLTDIATMLDFVAETGVVLPESLRKKIDLLMTDPNVQESGVSFAKRKER